MVIAEVPGLRARKKQLMRDRIVATAFERFEHQGYERTSLAEIGEGCDVSPRTVSNYFPQKVDILGAYREEMLAVVEATLAARASRPPLERVRAALLAVARENERHPSGRVAQRLLARHGSTHALERMQQRFRTAIRGALEGAQLRPGADLDLAVLALTAAHLAVIQAWAAAAHGALEPRVAALFELWRRGVEA